MLAHSKHLAAMNKPISITENSSIEEYQKFREQNRMDSAKALKASNQMLTETRKQMVAKYGNNMTPRVMKAYMSLGDAIEENYTKAMQDLGMSREELDNLQYNTEIYDDYAKDFEKGLKRRGITLEQLQEKKMPEKKTTDSGVRQSVGVNGHDTPEKRVYSFTKKKS